MKFAKKESKLIWKTTLNLFLNIGGFIQFKKIIILMRKKDQIIRENHTYFQPKKQYDHFVE